jgi:hypothetical protein
MRRFNWLIVCIMALTLVGVMNLSAQEGRLSNVSGDQATAAGSATTEYLVEGADEALHATVKNLENTALQLAARDNNVAQASLRVVAGSAETLELTQQVVIYYKIMNDLDGTTYGLALDPNGQQLDQTQLLLAEKEAYEARYGRISPELHDYLAADQSRQPVSVIIWLKYDATPQTVRPDVSSDAPPPYHEDELDALNDAIEAQLQQSIALITAPVAERLAGLDQMVETDQYMPLIYTTLTPDLITEVARWPEVDTIYLDGINQPALEVARPVIQAHTMYNRRMAGFAQRGAVIEVGGRVAAFNHNALTGNPWMQGIQDTTNVCSGNSAHSTGVAGIILSSHLSRFGISPGSLLRFGGSCNGVGTELTARSTAAADWGARAFNLSFGRPTTGFVNNHESRYYDTLVYNRRRTVIVAAGNAGTTGCSQGTDGYVWTPGVAYNVITVGNFNDRNTLVLTDDIMNPCSSWRTRRSAKPEVSAPGTLINSTTTSSPWTGNIGSGTSYAAPMVTGVALNLMQRNHHLRSWPEVMKAILMTSALHNIEGAARFSTYDGAGGINGAFADDVTRGFRGGWAGRSYTCSTATNYDVLTMPLVAGKRTRVAIAWDQNPNYSDYNNRPSADLDLRIIGPSGTVVASSSSAANIFEIVDFTPSVTGNYTLRVLKFRCDLTPARLGAAWWRAP